MRYLFIFLLSCSLHAIELSPGTDNASVYFISPNDGESISGKVTVRFGLENFGVAPAGTQILHTGHHHLIKIGRAHVRTPVTEKSRMPSSA